MSPALKVEIIPLTDLPLAATYIEESPQHHPVVLVVDDEEIIADTRVAILASWGYAAIACYDAETALEMVRVIPPEILVSDVILTRMNGVDLAVAIRSTVPDCKVILFSGRADSVDLLARAGHDFIFLQKPMHPMDLLARLAQSDLEVRSSLDAKNRRPKPSRSATALSSNRSSDQSSNRSSDLSGYPSKSVLPLSA